MFVSLDNFRDVGGGRSVDGRVVRTGRLFRSDSLSKLSAADVDAFARLGIRTVIDLRRPQEIATAGRIAEADGLRYVNISPQHRLWTDDTWDPDAGPERFLADRYHDLVREGGPGIGEALREVAAATTAPTVVHCFAGKDRTGVVIALVLCLIGLDDDTIAHDYALSNEWYTRGIQTDLPDHWLLAPVGAMTLFLAELAAEHGSVARFATATGVGAADVAALRANLLLDEGAP
jgi:protein tyrosine/serine phosphatase